MIDLRLKFLEDLKKESEQSVFDGNLRKLTATELKRHAELHPDLKLLFDETRKELLIEQSPVKNPMDIFLVYAYRGKDAQNEAVKMGFSKVYFPNSKHNKSPSEGLDTCPYPIDWNDLKRFKYMNQVMMRVAKRLNLEIRFGADFNMDGDLTNDKFVDLPHCEVLNARV